jgi:hypothetical protein
MAIRRFLSPAVTLAWPPSTRRGALLDAACYAWIWPRKAGGLWKKIWVGQCLFGTTTERSRRLIAVEWDDPDVMSAPNWYFRDVPSANQTRRLPPRVMRLRNCFGLMAAH